MSTASKPTEKESKNSPEPLVLPEGCRSLCSCDFCRKACDERGFKQTVEEVRAIWCSVCHRSRRCCICTPKESKKRTVEERLDSLEASRVRHAGSLLNLLQEITALNAHSKEHCSHIRELQNLAFPQLAKADKEAQENKRVRLEFIFADQLGDVQLPQETIFLARACNKCAFVTRGAHEGSPCAKDPCPGQFTRAAFEALTSAPVSVKKE